VLGRGVAAAALVGDPAGGRPDVDDDPGVSAEQRGQQRAGDLHQADHVDVVHAPPLLGVGLGDRRGAEGATRVVHEYVDPLAHLGGECRHGVGVGDVADDCPAADVGRERLDAVDAPGRADHLEPLGGQSPGGGRTDPARRTRHHRQPLGIHRQSLSVRECMPIAAG
jgi:hypothetical protein